ncbi:MAG: outer membrane lipoprotein-sorting protein [Candidatus Thiodiazotropha taylori]|nr:outer membrane lipoprotein-sorting protein [Candidatus Thiodiazotropha taylori]RLW69147.1 MAG: outer membrane lipoprotein-sorting protein [gamma proteobacterium symbiont of Stewartia floridana]MCG7956861.1 outer membrane lipoprotein-sorting protein [Candidatus Thiodiazotropha taylori]MCG7967881.1 outer membrane lipoprotein-sorting protein [Candidatus Thiodiazotropha taylori]MCG7975130.1 outer membrane lipoprotein-sorting protein [Candidatus Thiodiazotropha taylori]
MQMRNQVYAMATAGLLFSSSIFAGVAKDLPLPSGTPSADEVANQVYFVNHFYALKNFGITNNNKDPKKSNRAIPGKITTIVNKSAGSKPTTITVERYLNNDYGEGAINAQDIAIFRSGKLKGTGMLITDYVDENKSQSYSIWLPALRKIRRFAEPAHDDAWGGTDFTFGDVTLRKPKDETHELVGTETFNDCLGAIDKAESKNKYLPSPPDAACDHKGKEVYKLKSTTKRENWWYDYRISYVDSKTFADYRTEYFKGDKQVKVIDRDWRSLGLDDPRAQYWGYWYGKTLESGHETWAVIPQEIVQYDQAWKSDYWSEKTLRKIKR